MATVTGINPVQDYIKEIERLLKKYKLGKFAQPTVDYNGKILNLEIRLLNIEKALNIKDSATIAAKDPIKIEQEGSVQIEKTTPIETISIKSKRNNRKMMQNNFYN